MIRKLLLALSLALPLAAQPTDRYALVFLRPSPDRKPLPKEEGEKIQAAHMAHIRSMADSGALVGAGPFERHPDHHQRRLHFQGAGRRSPPARE